MSIGAPPISLATTYSACSTVVSTQGASGCDTSLDEHDGGDDTCFPLRLHHRVAPISMRSFIPDLELLFAPPICPPFHVETRNESEAWGASGGTGSRGGGGDGVEWVSNAAEREGERAWVQEQHREWHHKELFLIKPPNKYSWN